jgi:hypothetical protein
MISPNQFSCIIIKYIITATTNMARFALSNSQDHSAASWIVAFLLLSYTTLTTMVRGFVKFSMLGLDDGVAALAQLLAYGNALSVIIALRDGLAKSSPGHGTEGNTCSYEKVSKARLRLCVRYL